MRLTRRQLRQIIKEELSRTLMEAETMSTDEVDAAIEKMQDEDHNSWAEVGTLKNGNDVRVFLGAYSKENPWDAKVAWEETAPGQWVMWQGKVPAEDDLQ
jgi:hypothetical protein